ncbi:MAG TPA: dCTP deaminase [Candidatus Paceibacterota bacterium]|nr:dCTP deaminase [Candidatus Paceibacterota bacterium]HMP18941.1 dCTP deaminase [Candidatus Paceibacterota bacterium]HMP85500.1 dCTP deaminase [Candidatus Paceibacterota bacterium]
MSVLTQKQILERIKKGDLIFKPPIDEFQLQAHAVDLRLGYTFMIPKQWILTANGRESLRVDHLNDVNTSNLHDIIELEKGQYFELLPGEHVLASTLESIKWPADLMSVLYPKSSTNRRGLAVDLTGIIDAGYEGQLIIPIKNNTTGHSIRLYPGERFCQITFQELCEPSEKPRGTYHQKDIVEGFILNKKYKDYDMIKKGDVLELKEKYKIDLS